jgi:putative ABC transport system permease protein
MNQEHHAFIIHPHLVTQLEGIVINENYLDVNPIRTLNEVDIREQIKQDRYTLNLLVPEQFKYLENEIIEAYRNEFYFQKVYITNMFNEEVGEPLVEGITLDDLTVHLIYAEEGQSYFSFNRYYGGPSNTFYDPIAMILPGESADTSFVAAFVTTSLYFYDSSGQAYEAILPTITESEVVEINHVVSIYDEASQEIVLLQQQLFYQLIEVVLMIIFSLLMFGLFIWAYYQTNRYQLNLKYLFGYSFWGRHQLLVFLTLFSNLIAGRLVVLIFGANPSTVWWFIGGFFVIDLAMTKILSAYLSKRNILRVLKGDV